MRRPVLALAGAVWRGAWRSGYALVLLLSVAALLVWLPGQAGPTELFGGQAYGVWALGLGAAHAALLAGTGLLALDSMARDLRDGSAVVLAARGVGRAQWWLGRWLGALAIGLCGLALAVAVAVLSGRGAPPAGAREVRAVLTQPLYLAPEQWIDTAFAPPAGTLAVTMRVPDLGGQAVPVSLRADSRDVGSWDFLPGVTRRVPWPGGRIMVRNDSHGDAGLWSGADLALWAPATTGWGNLTRATGLMVLQLALVSAIGAAFGAWFTYPVALLALAVWLVVALLTPLVPTEAVVGNAHGHDHSSGAELGWVDQLAVVGRPLGLALTDGVTRWWPATDLAAGRLVASDGWLLVAAAMVLRLLVWVALAILGWLRRDVAAGDRT